MSAQPHAEVSRKVEEARKLIAAGKSRTDAAAAVGLPRTTLGYRLDHFTPAEHVPDNLPDTPTDAAEIPVFERHYEDQESHRIYPIGDLHIGSKNHADDRLDDWLGYLGRTPDVSMLNTGDNLNCALKTSVSETYDEGLTVQEGRRLLTEKFKPLAERDLIDAVIDGNHEMRVYRATGDSPNSAVCDALGINYSMASCVVRYFVGDQVYDVYLRHGSGGGRKFGGQVNTLASQDEIIDADVYVSGHTHTQVAFIKDHFVKGEDGEFARKKRLFVCSGSFLSYEDYAAQAGFPPAHIGAPRIFLDGRKHDQHGSV